MRKKGFTLIELLVVIAIIAILAVIIIVNLTSARYKAQQASAIEGLNRALSATQACIASGDSITEYSVATDPTDDVICIGASAVAQGNWPDIDPYSYDVIIDSQGASNVTVGDGQSGYGIVCSTSGSVITSCTKE